MKQLSGQRTMAILVAGIAALIVCTLAATWVLYGVYIKRSDAPLIRRIGHSFPVARVGSRTVTYGQFLEARDAIRTYIGSDAGEAAGLGGELTPEGERSALDRLVNQAAIGELASERQVAVAEEDVRASFAQIVLSASSTIPNVSQYLQDTFQWDEEQFRQKVIRPAILEERVAATFSSTTDEGMILLGQYLDARIKKPDVKIYLRF